MSLLLDMKNFRRYLVIFISVLLSNLFLSSCKEFFDPFQEINLTEDQMYDDWYEYRSAAMGLYGLQQELVEQIIILGELRGDLLTVTQNADADMIEINNFNISKENKYASPTNFFKLISASNDIIGVLEKEHPEVMDPAEAITNYDRLYGEVICVRAWAYFNAVRIYGKVPFIPGSLTSMGEVQDFLNSSGTYIDSVYIDFGYDGYHNDTTYNEPFELEKQYYDQHLIIDYFTNELETKVKAVGVNHFTENNDDTWEVTIWNTYAMNTFLGLMYLTQGDLAKAVQYFEEIIYLPVENNRYQLDYTFSNGNWENIFSNIDTREHIFTIWFNKANSQQNDLQNIFETRASHEYMLKPSRQAVMNWETIWDDYFLNINNVQPWETEVIDKGRPGDFHRGYGVSYAYARDGEIIPEEDIQEMLILKSNEDTRSAELITEDADTVVWKYSIQKNAFDEDANVIIYRAAGVHLWLAEAYIYYTFYRNEILSPFTSNAVNIINDGSNYSVSVDRPQLGVRGRVGFGGSNDGLKVGSINYIQDPYTNEVTGYTDITGDFLALQELLEDKLMEEKARELAFEGERFYDLMRVAKRRNDPAFLAERVSKKYPPDQQQAIYNLLLDENNWYIHYFD